MLDSGKLNLRLRGELKIALKTMAESAGVSPETFTRRLIQAEWGVRRVRLFVDPSAARLKPKAISKSD